VNPKFLKAPESKEEAKGKKDSVEKLRTGERKRKIPKGNVPGLIKQLSEGRTCSATENRP